MTKLEEEIKQAMWHKGESFDDEVRAAAEVAKRYIEKAWHDGHRTTRGVVEEITFAYWSKENGVLE